MTALERVTRVLERARVAGGWIDEDVAAAVLVALSLTDEGEPISREPAALDHE
jgi:hypothetical protein